MRTDAGFFPHRAPPTAHRPPRTAHRPPRVKDLVRDGLLLPG